MALAEERVTHWNREAFLRDAEGKRSVAMTIALIQSMIVQEIWTMAMYQSTAAINHLP